MTAAAEKSKSLSEQGEAALNDAFYELVRERRKTNDTLVFWKDGKSQEIPAREIPLPEDE